MLADFYEKDGAIGRITLNRSDAMNAISDEIPVQLSGAIIRSRGAGRCPPGCACDDPVGECRHFVPTMI
ncbi:MAG: hypothetical protein ACI92Z_001071 [Paracoccaceae bacterium]|jgi:hypothetical protein